ncbi:MAG TPA: preprotein translocase subunit SecA [Deltaproteobacteria bacterium]|jgi:preprotein translocase subunit SecA|nr:preprotein translocase subunit SecA [Deltaproteobacteria bacterium]OQC29283.1 MAG: preprotein translocase subunit SecA [Deltaproteobacteria bacterium ADurb.Bin072]HRW80247.1 preprotein translocase subunit SecA [Desulfomonilia bacterium]HNQ85437.1 preprotein translocase subunit SecA [Deltaproteobacteria bacterium]HNS89693.1 preprotein translocase subunit SecA [Deltaproteobacteria bacterium]
MLGWLIKIFGSRNERELKQLQPLVAAINAREDAMRAKSDADLKAMTPYFKDKLDAGAGLEDILPEAFATVREASRRTLNMRPFDVQLLGGIVLHQGKVAEMKTGEGKTLVATMPVYLNALAGKGAHVVTVNDYLARRDAEWMGAIYRFLGLDVGVIIHGLDDAQRKENYQADITYGTNNEFGFDFLRDNMKFAFADYVQRDFYYAIVDEVDSILIDEARTPLIISGPAEESTSKYYDANNAVIDLLRRPNAEELYQKDEKANSVMLSEEGIEFLQRRLGKANLYDPGEFETVHHLNQALRAHLLFSRDVHYVVKEGEVVIVDEFTGRLMPGRRYSEGLHQALEAKEGVKVANENQTLASITFQNYFRMYEKLAGMTGTAETEALELKNIYGLDVMVIPTNLNMIRLDHPDVIYKTEKEKYKAVVQQISLCHEKGQPVLVGTSSIENSEKVSSLLKRKGVPHNVLNAKHHEREAEIVAQAGRKGAVTIATNMAGRGTDIKLGGNPEFLARQRMSPEEEGYKDLLKKFTVQCEEEHREVVGAGGLFILGTERHESRRIDNQLRGRSGRQGDPGESRFYLSLEDNLMRIFGSERIAMIMDKLGVQEDEPIEHNLISKSIEGAQKKVEGRNFEIRKHLLEYDDVMNKQREVVYAERRRILSEENLKSMVEEILDGVLDDAIETYLPRKGSIDGWDIEGFRAWVKNTFDLGIELSADKGTDREDLYRKIRANIMDYYNMREQEFSPEVMRMVERHFLLLTLDTLWKDHLLSMDHLKDGIGLRGYGQKNPLREYQREGFDMFLTTLARVKELSLERLFKVQIQRQEDVEKVSQQERRQRMHMGRGPGEKAPTIKREGKKIGRNDPCPCGSGKKYKQCCGAGT